MAKALERGRAMMRVRLRLFEWKAAEAGSVRMLIWLGKQYLGQREPPCPPCSGSDSDHTEELLSNCLEEQLHEKMMALLATHPPRSEPEEPPQEGS